jgi:hypothetical protein
MEKNPNIIYKKGNINNEQQKKVYELGYWANAWHSFQRFWLG